MSEDKRALGPPRVAWRSIHSKRTVGLEFKDSNSYQTSAGSLRVRMQVLDNIARVRPVIDERKLKIGRVDTIEW